MHLIHSSGEEDPVPIAEAHGISSAGEALLDGAPPEPVDDDAIRALLADKLSKARREHVVYLIARYRAWHDAFGEAMICAD